MVSLSLFLSAFSVLYYLRKRCKQRQNARNVRKGESLLDDEDDLLISQMYA